MNHDLKRARRLHGLEKPESLAAADDGWPENHNKGNQK
jgi:hypothetical protein